MSGSHTSHSSQEEIPVSGEALFSSLRQEITELRSQLFSCEEQVYQHSLTIVNLEDKLLGSFSHSLIPAKVEVDMRDKDTTTENCFLENALTSTSDLKETPVSQHVAVADVDVSQKNTDASQIRYLQKRIFSLSEKLEQVEARLERSKLLNGKLQEALNLKSTLVSRQHSELTELRGSLPGVQSTLCQVQEEVSSISTNISTYNDAQSRFSPITELAAKCAQETHAQTIEKQAQALASMRAHVHQLEAANKFVPTHREAVQQVGELREELRRAKSALEGTDIAYLMQKKEVEEASFKQLLENRTAELEVEKETHELTQRMLHSSEDVSRELLVILSSKFYNLYRLDFKLLPNMSQVEMEVEMESRRKQINHFSVKLSEYEDEIMSRQPAIDAENENEIRRLNQMILDLKSNLERREEENISLKFQNELLEKQQLYSPKKERFHSCLFTQDMVDVMLDKERKRCKELLRKKNKELSILRKALMNAQSA